jgi:hypothetical protein
MLLIAEQAGLRHRGVAHVAALSQMPETGRDRRLN